MERSFFDQLYSAPDFRNHTGVLIEQLANHLESTTISKNHTINWNNPENELKFWKDFLENGKKEDFIPEVIKRTTHVHNPKCVGHQVSAPAPITALTSMVSGLLNNGMAIYEMGMSPSAIERIVTDILCQKIGYDDNAGGFLTSGGTLANLTALLSARKTNVNHDVWNEGHTKPLGIMVCEEAHYCIDRAAKIMGLGERGIIKIPAQDNFSMDVSLLEEKYQQATSDGIEVFAIIGSAPSTATGAYDDLNVIAEFAKSKSIWFHVDGAHGGAAIYSKKYKHLLDGIEEADSVVIDGHKMMFMPTITTALLFKNKWHAQHTFSQKADYLLNDDEGDQWYESGKKTFECTKTMMSLHWFVLMKFYGVELFDEYVTRQYDLAKEFEKMLIEDSDFELATSPQSNILCFQYMGDSLSVDQRNALNIQIRQKMLEDGEYYIVQTKLKGKHYLRTTLMNPFTTVDHLRDLLNSIKETAHRLS